MKKTFFVVILLCNLATYAQSNAPDPSTLKVVKEHYTPAFGLLGAANFSRFRVSGNDNANYDFKFGWGAGIYATFHLGRAIAFEPQLIYNSLTYFSDNSAFLNDSKAGYLSLPLLLKFHLGHNFAITAGPQFDLLMSVNDDNNNWEKDDVKSTSFAANVGIEIVPMRVSSLLPATFMDSPAWIIPETRTR